ncbi:hypothetical protein JO972_01335 [Verrucomicrobiaceae bacterium 5K15]|uniref:Uncharacterized protein n=1 Tax=Oceaniferula flava TaxID=2800421 RepID=A0AAE2VAQ3_9BACT|nr:hypothetical protein [Oceaniferula flavus]MBK1853590.1 hypothetical protein [Oceaniferula flavus]MBM1134895.1 hypothetical protein [Oceaniferula flavus]
MAVIKHDVTTGGNSNIVDASIPDTGRSGPAPSGHAPDRDLYSLDLAGLLSQDARKT